MDVRKMCLFCQRSASCIVFLSFCIFAAFFVRVACFSRSLAPSLTHSLTCLLACFLQLMGCSLFALCAVKVQCSGKVLWCLYCVLCGASASEVSK